LTLAFLKFNIF